MSINIGAVKQVATNLTEKLGNKARGTGRFVAEHKKELGLCAGFFAGGIGAGQAYDHLGKNLHKKA